MFDIMSHVETAAFGNEPSFIDYLAIRNQNLRIFVKASVMEIGSDFYETTTPKAPLDVNVRLYDIGNTTFTVVNELSCGGKLKPSIRTRSVYAVINKKTGKIEPTPDWWRRRFVPLAECKSQNKQLISPVEKSGPTYRSEFTIPLNDTDHNERTRCSSYLNYFNESTSVASRKELLKHIKSSFHEFHVKRLSMLYFGPTGWGDTLTAETWQSELPLQILCEIRKDNVPVWFGKMDLHERVYGFPELETKPNKAGGKSNKE